MKLIIGDFHDGARVLDALRVRVVRMTVHGVAADRWLTGWQADDAGVLCATVRPYVEGEMHPPRTHADELIQWDAIDELDIY